MVKIVEYTPRLDIRQIKDHSNWDTIRAAGRLTMVIEGLSVKIDLDTDEATFGTRYWFLCPCCSARRRHLYLYNNLMACRKCKALVYFQQTMTMKFRTEVGYPALRAAKSSKSGSRIA